MSKKLDTKRLKSIRIPWIPFLYKPTYKLAFPEINFADPKVRQSVFVVMMIFATLMSAGIIYMLVNPPPALITVYEKPKVILPDTDRQTIMEGIAVFALFIMATSGLYIIRRSTEYFTEEESRGLWLSLGFVLVLVSALALTYFLSIKMAGLYQMGGFIKSIETLPYMGAST